LIAQKTGEMDSAIYNGRWVAGDSRIVQRAILKGDFGF